MPTLLLFQAFAQRLHEFFPSAERFDQLLFFLRQQQLGLFAQPFFGDLGHHAIGQRGDAPEVRAEYAVELVVVRFVLDQAGARQVIEFVQAAGADTLLQCLHERQVFIDGRRHPALAQLQEEIRQQGNPLLPSAVRRLIAFSAWPR